MKRTNTKRDIQQQVAEFEQQNPKVAEAMALFGVSIEKYQGALHAMNGPRVYLSDSTTPKDRQQRG